MIFRKCIAIVIDFIKKFFLFPVGIFLFMLDVIKFCTQSRKKSIPVKGFIPMFMDKYKPAGDLDRHYFLQDLYVAQKVIEHHPAVHYDIGSRVDGFIGHLLVSLNRVVMLDIRPFPHKVKGLDFIQTDATNLMEIEDSSIGSKSSLHAIEHFGLGRYGDCIDPEACFSAMKAMQRVVCGGGILFFSVPIAMHDGVYFNSHRVFAPKTIVKTFNQMTLLEFAHIHDYKITSYVGNTAIELINNERYNLGNYDCGIFILKKMLNF